MLLLQLAAAADTILVRSVPPVRTTFEQIVFVASGLTSIVAFLLICLTMVLLVALRAKADAMRHQLDILIAELHPMARKASEMSEDVREVAKNVNAMVDDSRETVKVVNERVRTSVVMLTDRVDEMSAIIGRVNDSAERVARVATTTVAGIKFGARALGFGKTKKKRRKDATERPRLRRRD